MSESNILVIGAGQVGLAEALNLANEYSLREMERAFLKKAISL
jgi:saccharopine dehydrogenase-like NADP-dependent oxidoreductase